MPARSHAAIVKAARAEKERLLVIFNRIEDEKDDILEKQLTGTLNANDLKALDTLSADQDVIRRALKDLGLITVQSLDRTDEVRFVLNALVTAQRRLDKAKSRLSRFGKTANDLGDRLESLQKLADRLKERLTELV